MTFLLFLSLRHRVIFFVQVYLFSPSFWLLTHQLLLLFYCFLTSFITFLIQYAYMYSGIPLLF